MSSMRFLVPIALVLAGGSALLAACSDEALPKAIDPVGSKDAGVPFDAGPVDPCDPPVEGCPCADAGVGSQVYCGVVYRTSGDHVDCSKGYRTCQEDGGWGKCEGMSVYVGD